jgi:spermidine synthase
MGAFEDPRLELHHVDARAYLQTDEARYDVVILDLVDPLEEGTAYQLYTKEFYEIVKNSLKPDGIMVTQSGSSDITNFRDCYVPIVHTIRTVFNWVDNYQVNISGFGMPWSFTIASQTPRDTNGIGLDKCNERINRNLRFYDYESHVHMFNIPKYVRDELAMEARINSDDNPIFMV